MMRYLVLACLLAAPIDGSASPGAIDLVQQAVETYQTALDTRDRDHRIQLFGRAESLFASAIKERLSGADSGPVSADLYLNLGNAALGAEHLGPAILAYRRALLAQPNHQRARQNLEHARTLLPDWVPIPDDSRISVGSFFDWASGLKRGEWQGLAAAVFLITMVLLAIYLRTGKATARNLAVIGTMMWAGCVAWPLLGGSPSTRAAVVVVPEAAARSADSFNSPSRFPEPLPSGAEIEIVEVRDDWIRVQLADSRQAWLPAGAVEFV